MLGPIKEERENYGNGEEERHGGREGYEERGRRKRGEGGEEGDVREEGRGRRRDRDVTELVLGEPHRVSPELAKKPVANNVSSFLGTGFKKDIGDDATQKEVHGKCGYLIYTLFLHVL